MSARVELLRAIEPVVELKAADEAKFLGLVDKALKPLVKAVPLEAVKSFQDELRDEMKTVILSAMTLAELKVLSKKWAPQQKWKKDAVAEDVRQYLLALI